MWKCSATLQALRKRMYKNERKQRKGDVIVMTQKELEFELEVYKEALIEALTFTCQMTRDMAIKDYVPIYLEDARRKLK